jgi:hypothetical protein
MINQYKNDIIVPSALAPIENNNVQMYFSYTYFYKLHDPITQEICYIGQTHNPHKRYKQHCDNVYNFRLSPTFSIWIYSLYELNQSPVMTIINKCNFSELGNVLRRGSVLKFENVLIKKYWNMGCPLLNRSRYILSIKQYYIFRKRFENCLWMKQRGHTNKYYSACSR